MWGLANKTSFRADRAFVRDLSGAEIWLVAVRATFVIRPDGKVVPAPAEKQQAVCKAPVHFGPPESSSVRYDSDLVRTKLATDVLVNGSAHSPGGKPATFVDVALRVGPLQKALRVIGDRTWDKRIAGLAPSAPAPFLRKPIRYESAWGGALGQPGAFDRSNPVGVGRLLRSGEPLPNCERLGKPVDSKETDPFPVGFGPIACHWQPRAKLAGTYDKTWEEQRRPLLPADFQDLYFQAAPTDQQAHGFLRGGEEVRLLNLSPEGRLDFSLPRISLGFSTWIGGEVVHHDASLHTVIIEPDERRLIMVWHTALPCHHTMHTLEETAVFEKRRIR